MNTNINMKENFSLHMHFKKKEDLLEGIGETNRNSVQSGKYS